MCLERERKSVTIEMRTEEWNKGRIGLFVCYYNLLELKVFLFSPLSQHELISKEPPPFIDNT